MKIIQIIPATGVWAVWKVKGESNFCSPVEVIALVEDEGGERFLQYMEADDQGEFDVIEVRGSNCVGFFHSVEKPTDDQLNSYGREE